MFEGERFHGAILQQPPMPLDLCRDKVVAFIRSIDLVTQNDVWDLSKECVHLDDPLL